MPKARPAQATQATDPEVKEAEPKRKKGATKKAEAAKDDRPRIVILVDGKSYRFKTWEMKPEDLQALVDRARALRDSEGRDPQGFYFVYLPTIHGYAIESEEGCSVDLDKLTEGLEPTAVLVESFGNYISAVLETYRVLGVGR